MLGCTLSAWRNGCLEVTGGNHITGNRKLRSVLETMGVVTERKAMPWQGVGGSGKSKAREQKERPGVIHRDIPGICLGRHILPLRQWTDSGGSWLLASSRAVAKVTRPL